MRLPSPRKTRSAPAPMRPTQAPLSASAVYRHLLIADDGLWAWFKLADVDWLFCSLSHRDEVRHSATARYAELIGHRVHLRVTSQPLPVWAWARGLDQASPNRLADVEGAESWADFLVSSQEALAGDDVEEPAVFLGVRVTDEAVKAADLGQLLGRNVASKGLEPHRKTLRAITRAVAADAFNAEPLTSLGVAWLMTSSVALGAPVSQDVLRLTAEALDAHALAAITAPVQVAAAPWSNTVEVVANRDGRRYQHHVSVLTCRVAAERDTDDPRAYPWMAFAQQLGFGVEFSAILDVYDGHAMRASAEFARRRAGHLADGYAEHDEAPPRHVERAAEDAARIEDEVTAGSREIGCRLAGTVRAGVWGATPDEVADRAGEFIREYARELGDEWVQTFGQHAISREFIPGEGPSDDDGFYTVMPAYYLAAAVPNATARLGDYAGPYLGRAVGFGRSPFCLDPQWGPKNNMSGLCPILGDVGSGKSTAGGAIIEADVRRGHQAIMFDPSGRILLHTLPHLAPYARIIELANMGDGVLNPGTMVPEPRRADYGAQAEYLGAAREAAAERIDLMVDSLIGLLPAGMLRAQYGVTTAIEQAAGIVGGWYGTSPWAVVEQLAEQGGIAAEAATALRTAAELKGGSLIFPRRGAPSAEPDTDFGATLTAITMRGLAVPPKGSSPEHWTRAQRASVPVIHLASRLAMRGMYADKSPKSILSDEAGISAAGSHSFADTLTRAALESRKQNTWLGVLGQNPTHFTTISSEVENLTGMVMVGRMRDRAAAESALDLLHIERGYGYEKTLLALSTGQFLIRDWKGRHGVRQIDLDHRPQVLAALNTTPDQSPATEGIDTLQLVQGGAA